MIWLEEGENVLVHLGWQQRKQANELPPAQRAQKKHNATALVGVEHSLSRDPPGHNGPNPGLELLRPREQSGVDERCGR